MNSKTLSILILAAGASKRMGSTIKQLLPWGNTTLLGHAIQQAKALHLKTYAVLGAHADEIKSRTPNETGTFVNPNWEKGMGNSIAFGVGKVLQINPQTETILIMLADQPLIHSTFLKALFEEYQKQGIGIAATAYPNKRVGVPAVFSAPYFSNLLGLNEDKGARQLLNAKNENIVTIPIGEKGVDIDTIEDYNALLASKKPEE
ncbi:MAG: nucleotidyltransferase family protein [Bacteroidota bacterium]